MSRVRDFIAHVLGIPAFVVIMWLLLTLAEALRDDCESDPHCVERIALEHDWRLGR